MLTCAPWQPSWFAGGSGIVIVGQLAWDTPSCESETLVAFAGTTTEPWSCCPIRKLPAAGHVFDGFGVVPEIVAVTESTVIGTLFGFVKTRLIGAAWPGPIWPTASPLTVKGRPCDCVTS